MMESHSPLRCNTDIACAAIIRVIMSSATDTTKPGKNYVRTFAVLIRLHRSVVITERRMLGAPILLTTNLSAFRPFTPCRNDTRQGCFLSLPQKPLFYYKNLFASGLQGAACKLWPAGGVRRGAHAKKHPGLFNRGVGFQYGLFRFFFLVGRVAFGQDGGFYFGALGH